MPKWYHRRGASRRPRAAPALPPRRASGRGANSSALTPARPPTPWSSRRRPPRRPRPQGMAQGPVAAQEPQRAAARLRPGGTLHAQLPAFPVVDNGGIAAAHDDE